MSEATTMKLLEASEEFVEGWTHFCSCIDFGKSALDARAIRWMNEVPAKLACAAGAMRGVILINHAEHAMSQKKDK